MPKTTSPTHNLSLKTRWIIWRARMSTPALLTRLDERKVLSGVVTVGGGLSILTIGLFAWLTGLPVLFPALGPTIFILFTNPLSHAAAPRSVILSHIAAMACGLASWHLVGYITGSPISTDSGGLALFLTSTLTLAASCLLLIAMSCPHPPACASGLVVALGAVTDVYDLVLMADVIVFLVYQAFA